MKRDNWKQTNPKDQMIVLLAAIEGWADLGYTDPQRIQQKLKELLEQVSQLSTDYLIEKW